jgi:hypothetical protein
MSGRHATDPAPVQLVDTPEGVVAARVSDTAKPSAEGSGA